ncbi:hypothetical protein [Acidipila sp. EB88]|nr:hypothetical protein [Acidipila sp. EB88]
MNTAISDEKVTSSSLSVALAWAVVVLPAAWGVYNTVLRAINLFTK